MGPKKKGKEGKKKKAEKPPKTTKTQYLAKIAERNAELAQARKKTEEVENIYFDAENSYEQTQQDMADIIKYLLHEIRENEDEIAAFDEKITCLKLEISKNDKYYESIISKMETDYEEKNKDLQNQIRLTAAKIFASEEVKQQREEYLKRKEALRLKKLEMEARHRQEIYIAERQAIIKQDTMQKDLERNVARLGSDFKQATDIAIGETTNNLIKDNIILGNTLTCMQEILEKARCSYEKARMIERTHRQNAELLQEEYSLVVKKYNSRINRIENLIRSHEDVTERIALSQRLIKDNRRLQRQIAEHECILKEKTQELLDLLKILDENEEITTTLKNNFNIIRKNVIKLEFAIYEVAIIVKEGVDVEFLTHLDVDDEAVEMSKEEQEENLKEYKYKVREKAIEGAIAKLSVGMLTDTELQLIAPASESYLNCLTESGTIENAGKVT